MNAVNCMYILVKMRYNTKKKSRFLPPVLSGSSIEGEILSLAAPLANNVYSIRCKNRPYSLGCQVRIQKRKNQNKKREVKSKHEI